MIFMGLALVHFQKYWLLSNGNSPNNTDPITEMELEHAFEPDYNNIKWFFQGPVNRGGKDNSYEIVSELTSNDVEEEVYSSLNDDTPSMKSKRHKIDITERSSKCLCPYLHPKTWGVAYFDPKKYTLKFFVFTFEIIIVLERTQLFIKIHYRSIFHMAKNWRSMLEIGLRNSLLYLICAKRSPQSMLGPLPVPPKALHSGGFKHHESSGCDCSDKEPVCDIEGGIKFNPCYLRYSFHELWIFENLKILSKNERFFKRISKMGQLKKIEPRHEVALFF